MEKLKDINLFDSELNILDTIYPVGSLYWTRDSSFDPNISFVGHWEKIEGKFVLAAGGGYNNLDSGGRATVSGSDLPKHTHAIGGTATGSTTSTGGHSHNVSVTSDKDVWVSDYVATVLGPGSAYFESKKLTSTGSTTTNGDHNHNVSVNLPANTGNNTENANMNIMPPYTVRICWERLS